MYGYPQTTALDFHFSVSSSDIPVVSLILTFSNNCSKRRCFLLMAIASCTSLWRLANTIGNDKDHVIRRKDSRSNCICLHVHEPCTRLPSKRSLKGRTLLCSCFLNRTGLTFQHKEGRWQQRGWEMNKLHSRPSKQEDPTVPECHERGNHIKESQSSELKEEEPIEGTTNKHAAAVKTIVFWVCSAVIFGIFIGLRDGTSKASEFFAGYLLEQSLSVDNLFVFILIFKYFKVPTMYQSRVLSYGIAGAIIFRASMILLGAATLEKYEIVNLFLAGILLYSSLKLFSEADDEDEDLSNNFIVKTCKKFIPVTSAYDGDKFITYCDGARKATPLLLTVAVVELSDIAFAVDSIPAVFGITRDPFTVFSSNMFAILGLRSLYTLISGSISELEYLQPAVGAVLGFIACKMIADYFGYHTPTEVSLGVVAAILGIGVTLSLLIKSEDKA